PADARWAAEPARVGRDRGMDAEDVTKRPRVFRRLREVQRNDLIADVGPAGRKSPAPHDDRHAERMRALRHFLADVPVAEQAEGSAEQAFGSRILLLVPLSGAQLDAVVGDAPIEREAQR